MEEFIIGAGTGFACVGALGSPAFRRELSGNLTWYDFSLGGHYAVFVGASNPKLMVLDTRTWEVVFSDNSIGTAYSCSVTQDGAYIAVGFLNGNRYAIYQTSDWSVVAEPTLPTISDNSSAKVSFSPDDQTLVIYTNAAEAANGSAVTLVDTATWSVIPGPVVTTANAIGWSWDSQTLSIGGNGESSIVDMSAPTVIAETLTFSGINQNAIAFSHDDTMMAVEHSSGTRLTIFDTTTWQVIGSPSPGNQPQCLQFSVDDSMLYVSRGGSPNFRVYDTATWTTQPAPWAGTYTNAFSNFEIVAPNPDFAAGKQRLITRASSGTPQPMDVGVTNVSDGLQVFSGQSDANGVLDLYHFDPNGALVRTVEKNPSVVWIPAEVKPITELLYLDAAYSGTPVLMEGNVTKISGEPADEVVIHGWTTRKLVATATPDQAGDWQANVPPGEYSVSYFAENCRPVTHGPYAVELPE